MSATIDLKRSASNCTRLGPGAALRSTKAECKPCCHVHVELAGARGALNLTRESVCFPFLMVLVGGSL